MKDKPKSRNPCLDAAFTYLGYGWSPIPLRERGKKPAGIDGQGKWEEFQQSRAKPEQLEKAWQVTPNANVGVVMGLISGIVSIDVDGIAGDEELYELSGGVLPKTLSFNTGRDDSYRFIFKLPMGHPCPSIVISNNLKILGNGSQSAMPPSVHPNGDKYCWIVDRDPVNGQLLDAPPWLLTLLRSHMSEGRRTGQSTSNEKNRMVGDGEVIKEGGRESTLITYAGAVRRYGATQFEMYEMLRAVNNRCDPPLPDHDLQRIARSVFSYKPAAVPPTPQLVQRATVLAKANTIRMDNVKEEKLNWLWPNWMALGTMTCVDGDGGVGKSTMLIDLAARITRGDVMPDGVKPLGINGPQNVLMIACEDMLNQVIKPRVMAAGAVEARMHYLETVNDITIKKPRQIEFPADAETLGEEIKNRQIKFCFIDPIVAFMGGKNDSHRDQDVRAVLAPLKAIAEQQQCCIVYLRHWNKGGAGAKASYRGGGSLAFVNAARCGWLVGKNPENENQSIVAFHKGNLSKPPASLVFEMIPVKGKDGICSIKWLGASKLTANEISRASDGVNDEAYVGHNAADEAKHFVKEMLSKGKIQAKVMQKEAKDAGLSWITVRRAKDELAESVRENNQWYWQLKPETQASNNEEEQATEEAEEDSDSQEESPQDTGTTHIEPVRET